MEKCYLCKENRPEVLCKIYLKIGGYINRYGCYCDADELVSICGKCFNNKIKFDALCCGLEKSYPRYMPKDKSFQKEIASKHQIPVIKKGDKE